MSFDIVMADLKSISSKAFRPHACQRLPQKMSSSECQGTLGRVYPQQLILLEVPPAAGT